MGPVFYLVQCEEELLLISAVILGNWPHEFALAPSPGKKGGRTAAGSVCAGCPRPRPAAEKKKREMGLPARARHQCFSALY